MLDRLESLVEAARQGEITAAARTLGITQPAVTRRIQQLEAEFDTLLLERSRKGVVLTEPGRLVEAEARLLLERVARLRERIRAHLRLETGMVRVGGGATVVSYLLPETVRSFRARHKDIVFHLKEAGSHEIAADVASEDLDLGIVTLPVDSAELDVAELTRDRIVCVAARQHPLAGRKRVPARALSGESLIGFEGGSAIRRLIDRALERAGVSMRVVMELRSIPSILRMVDLEHGLAFISQLGVTSQTPVIPIRGLRIERTLAVVTKRGRPLSVAADAFLRHLRQRA